MHVYVTCAPTNYLIRRRAHITLIYMATSERDSVHIPYWVIDQHMTTTRGGHSLLSLFKQAVITACLKAALARVLARLVERNADHKRRFPAN